MGRRTVGGVTAARVTVGLPGLLLFAHLVVGLGIGVRNLLLPLVHLARHLLFVVLWSFLTFLFVEALWINQPALSQPEVYHFLFIFSYLLCFSFVREFYL